MEQHKRQEVSFSHVDVVFRKVFWNSKGGLVVSIALSRLGISQGLTLRLCDARCVCVPLSTGFACAVAPCGCARRAQIWELHARGAGGRRPALLPLRNHHGCHRRPGTALAARVACLCPLMVLACFRARALSLPLVLATSLVVSLTLQHLTAGLSGQGDR
eukprot:3271020-Rhodomonas_salina.1